MIPYQREEVKIEIVDPIYDEDLYGTIEDLFKSSRFYQSADFILSYDESGITLNFTGSSSRNYRVEFGDFVFEFSGSQVLKVPGSGIESRTISVKIERDGKYFGEFSIAFVYYMIASYVLVQIAREMFADLEQTKVSRYLLDNIQFSAGMEIVYGKRFQLDRFTFWSFEEYRNIMIQVVSAYLKFSGTEKAINQAIDALGYKSYAKQKKFGWRWIPGYSRLGSNWVLEPV